MTDLTPEQVEQWAADEACAKRWEKVIADALRYYAAMPGYYNEYLLHAHAKILQQQAENESLTEKCEQAFHDLGVQARRADILSAKNAEQQATIERLEERGQAFMNAVFLNDGNVVGAGADFAEVLNDLRGTAKQALQGEGK